MTRVTNFFNYCYYCYKRLVLWHQLRVLKRNFQAVASLPHDEAKEVITKWKWHITKSEANDEVKDSLYASVTSLEKLLDENPELGPLAAELKSFNEVFLIQCLLAVLAITGMVLAKNYTAVGWVVLSTAWCYSYCKARKILAHMKANACQKKN